MNGEAGMGSTIILLYLQTDYGVESTGRLSSVSGIISSSFARLSATQRRDDGEDERMRGLKGLEPWKNEE